MLKICRCRYLKSQAFSLALSVETNRETGSIEVVIERIYMQEKSCFKRNQRSFELPAILFFPASTLYCNH